MARKKKGVFLDEVERDFEAEVFKRNTTEQAALKQAVELWLGRSLPALPPELPPDMNHSEAKIAGDIIRGRRVSKRRADAIDALLNILREVKGD